MCGIAGIFSCDAPERTWPPDAMNSMVEALRHRGPDGSGSHVEPGLFLGHTRLAVLDLTTAGSQPMFSDDHRFAITFNGEIYNFRELRDELKKHGCRFTTRSDTEVLLAAWQHWGEETLGRLDGIFAFAIADRRERTLFLVRDPLGVKPLFYQMRAGQLFFASELLALFSEINPPPPYDFADLDTYFTFNYLPAPRTGLTGVKQLPAGTLLTVDAAGMRERIYWQPHYTTVTESRSDGMTKHFMETLQKTVSSQTVSDAPLGLFLSGGLDSYAVSQAVTATGLHPTAFTLGFNEPGFDETPAASDYARHLGIDQQVARFHWDRDIIEKTLGSMGELLADASCFPLYQLAAFASARATVVMAGDGGDELLAGYDTYLAGEITPAIAAIPTAIRGGLRSLARLLPSDSQRYGARILVERLLDAAAEGKGRDHASFRRIFGTDMKARLYTPGFRAAVGAADPIAGYASLIRKVPAERSFLTGRQHADICFHLPSILAKVDRMSMAHGLEVRVPLLGKELVELCLNLPDFAKRRGLKGKIILREALAGKIPPEALARPKAGFLPPVDGWFASPGPMADIFAGMLDQARTNIDVLDWNAVNLLWHEHRQGKIKAGFVLLGILQFINWSNKCRNLSN